MATTGADSAFLDTNVLVHSTAPSSSLHARARGALLRLDGAGHEVWVSRQILREFFAVVTRPQTFLAPVPPEEAAADLRRMEARFRVAEDGPEVMARLRELVVTRRVHGRQVHDANIVATMLAHGVGRLVTLNARDFRRYEPLVAVEDG
jgi:predicted nucleic acid-binding protein